MSSDLILLILAALGFVGSHLALSHPWRAPMVRMLGEAGFLGVYSFVAAITLGLVVAAFRAIGPGGAMLWDGAQTAPWAIASLLTLLAMVLFLGSLRGNPAAPGVGAEAIAKLTAQAPHGVYAVTRHPMLWGVVLWALAHALVAPSPRGLVLTASMAGLALIGAYGQDRKKAKLLGPAWQGWAQRTSYAPRLAGFASVPPLLWLIAVLVWLGVTFAHIHAAGVPAGLWRWL